MFPRLFIGIVIVALAQSAALCQDNTKNITREQQIFSPLNEQAPSRNAGMFVGVNKFTEDNGLNELAYAVHDAIETAYLFAFEVKLIRPDQCYLLLSGPPESKTVQTHLDQLKRLGATIGNASRTQILRTFVRVSRFAEKDSDLLICSFSSHGFEDRGDAYVMPADGFRELLAATAVPLKEIERNMERSKAGHRLLLVDACQERISARSSSQAGKPATDALITALQTPSGQAKLASCSSGQFSYEHGSLGGVGHGVFTWALLDALRGGAKPDNENLVRLGSVADYVAVRVNRWTTENRRQKQTPFLKSPIETRQLPLAEKADDLTTMLASLRRQPASGGFTRTLRDQLAEYLPKAKMSDSADRELFSVTRDFLNGRMRVNVFAAYIERDRDRWSPLKKILTNSIGMKLALIPAGEFMMGSPESETDRDETEQQHRVRITKSFYLGTTEITQGQWESVMGTTPWNGADYVKGGANYAASCVSWEDAVEFCGKLSAKDGKTYRLPTEAEWEYACRGDTTTVYHFGDDASRLGDYAWFNDNAWDIDEKYAHLVGQKKGNAFGLYDMHGNVYEWCSDWHGEDYYGTSPNSDPVGPNMGLSRVSRGGSWRGNAWYCRSANRNRDYPSYRNGILGFRVVCSPSRQ